jgi:flagellar biosynthesis protein FlhA
VVFLILVVVQYVVVTSGAQRVAEVAARFTLDSMPGKQMSIDADMNMGLIDEHEARKRRSQVEKEASFYGAMDGATKFVKGDAIAGIIIILINITAGMAVGIAQLGMSWGEAVQRFTLLTIGDGIVTQIPSLIIAIATGIIITRAASDAQLGREIPKQVLSNSKSLIVVALALVVLMMMPGFPIFPVLIVFIGVVAIALIASKNEKLNPDLLDKNVNSEKAKPVKQSEISQLMNIEPIEVCYGSNLNALLGDNSDLSERISSIRRQFAQDYGFVLPKVVLSQKPHLKADAYEICIQGDTVGKGELISEYILAINPGGQRAKLEGIDTKDPAYGLPAQWIKKEQRQLAKSHGYTLVDPDTVLITHFTEIAKKYSPELLTRSETEQLVNRIREKHASLIDELIPNILSYTEIQKVFQGLLREQVSVRNIELILEVLLDVGKTTKNSDELAERVRERLGGSICQRLVDENGDLQVLTISPEIERTLIQNLRTPEMKGTLFNDMNGLDGFIKALAKQSESMMSKSLQPVLLCPSIARRPLRGILQRSLPYISVLGINEVPSTASVRSFATITTN